MSTPPSTPTIIAQRYVLHEKLGQGGMGIVFRAMDRLTGEAVALKQVVLTPDQLQFSTKGSTNQYLALAEEFRTLASLRHPHIVSVLDYGFDVQRQPFLVMPLIENGQHFLEATKRLPLPEQIDLLQQVLQALAYLHRRGVIHRDLKPSNILVENGTAKILDFGLAQARTEDTIGSQQEAVGTLKYMAPELFQGMSATESSDLWAVGIMFYELLAQKPPFDDKNIAKMLHCVLYEPFDLNPLAKYPALGMLVERLLAKKTKERYRQVSAVLHDLALVLGEPVAEDETLRESFLQAAQFVGRASELETLQSAIKDAFNGKGSLWLVGGESGVGKSRLLNEARTFALVNGVLVVRGQGVAEGLPFQLWRDVLPRLVLGIELTDLEAGILQEIVPHISDLLGRPISPAPSLQGKEGLERLILTIQAVLQRQTQPVVLLLEDLQWAGESLLPLEQLMHHLDHMSLLIVASYRHDEEPHLPDKLPDAHTLLLPRLNPTAIAELSASMLGEVGLQPAILDLMTRESEGNIFFMVEVARALAEDAGTLDAIGQGKSLPEGILTGGMNQLLQRRLARLDPTRRPLLALAAVAGCELDLTLLRHLAPAQDVEAWLYAGQDAMILEVQGTRWQFAHDKLREAILQDEAHVGVLHHQVAESIERLYDTTTYAEILMHHWQKAGDADREFHYLLMVVDEMLHTSARYAQAQKLLEHSLTLPNAQTSAVLWRHWGILRHEQGRYAEAIDYLQKSLNLQPDASLHIRLMIDMGSNFYALGNYSTSQTYIETALAEAREIGDTQGLGSALNRLSLIYHVQNENERAYAVMEEAIAIWRESGYLRGIAGAMTNLGNWAYRQHLTTQAEAYYTEALHLHRTLGDQKGIAGGLNNLGNVATQKHDFAQARLYLEEALAMKRAIGDPKGISISLNNLAEVLWHSGDYGIAHAYFEEALAIKRRIGDQRGMLICMSNLLELDMEQHRPLDKTLFREALQGSEALKISMFTIICYLQLVQWHLNERRPVQGAEWLGFIQQYPQHLKDYADNIEKKMSQLRSQLDEVTLQSAFERGHRITMADASQRALAEIEG